MISVKSVIFSTGEYHIAKPSMSRPSKNLGLPATINLSPLLSNAAPETSMVQFTPDKSISVNPVVLLYIAPLLGLLVKVSL